MANIIPLPVLPKPPVAYNQETATKHNNALILFFNKLTNPGPISGTRLNLNELPACITLNTGVNAVVGSFILDNAAGFPTSGVGLIESEKFSYTGITVNTLTGVVRGILGTTAAAHLAGVEVVASATTGDVYASTTRTLKIVP